MNHLHIHRLKEAHLILYSIFFTRQVITFVHLKGIFRLLIPSGDMSFPHPLLAISVHTKKQKTMSTQSEIQIQFN